AFEIAIATDYQNVINKAQNTYMRPKDGAANQKIHQWETSAQAAGDFSSYQWELIPATIEGYYYFKNKSTGKIHKPTGESNGDSSLDGSFDLDATTKDNDYFMYALEQVVSGGGVEDQGYYWIKNKGSGYYVRPNNGGGPVDDGTGTNTLNAVQLRHQSATTPIDGPNSYRWSFVPRTEAGTLSAHVWSGTAWDKIVPPRYNNAQIDGNYSLATNGSLNVNNLAVSASAVLTVEAGQTLVVNGNLTNNGSVIVESGGSLLTKGSITGTGFTIKRNTTFSTSEGKYSIIGSPVTAASTSVLGNIVYTYDESTAYGGNQERFNQLTSPISMAPAEGYFSANTGEVTFTGTPNTGTITATMIYDTDKDGSNAGFNLVSNPYPTAISYDAFMSTNLTTNAVVSGTIYLWDDGGSDGSQRTNGDYITANTMGAATGGSTRSGGWNGYIGSGQGFFVKATQSGSLSFTDDMKVSGNNMDASYFRKAEQQQKSTYQTVKLVLLNKSTGKKDEILIGFAADATEGIDLQYDAQKFGEIQGTKFYSLITDEVPYTIQGLPITNDIIEVPLGASFETNAEFSIEVVALNNWPSDLILSLVDDQTNEVTKLTQNTSYTFSSIAGIDNSRFKLNVGTYSILSATEESFRLETVFTKDAIEIKGGSEGFKVEIMDMSGRMLLEKSLHPATNKQMVHYSFESGEIYLIKVHSRENS
ncbi:MAG: hypothetical protein RIC03_07690, partial [Cyclobacteriaceae bacterium]